MINRLRLGSERRYYRLFRKILNSQIVPVMESIDLVGVEGTIAKMETVMSQDPVANGYERLYTDVGPKFAKITAKDVKEDDEWIRLSMLHFVRQQDGAILHRIVSVTDTSREQALKLIQEELDRGLQEGMGVPEIARNIKKNVPREWTKISKFRAQRIAQTEVVAASNYGSLKGAQSSSLPMNKVWLAGGANIRPAHLNADGESVPVNSMFIRTGEEMEYPGDVRGSSGNVINCKCAIAYEVAKN